MSIRAKIISVVLLGTMAINMTGCATAGEFSRIEMGMSQSEVAEIWGSSGNVVADDGGGNMTIQYPGRRYRLNGNYAHVKYENNQVVSKEMRRNTFSPIAIASCNNQRKSIGE